MSNGFDPYAQFSTPEFDALDIYTKWLRVNETFPNHPAYNTAETGVREQMRNQMLGAANSDELYRGIFNELEKQGADTVTKNRVFNGLVADDEEYEGWELGQKQEFRKGLAGQMGAKAEGYERQGLLGQTFAPKMTGEIPAGEGLPARPIEPPSIPEAVENLTAIAARDEMEKRVVAADQHKAIMREIFERKAMGPGARKLYRSVLELPLMQDTLAPWINRAVAIPSELTRGAAQAIEGVGEAQEFVGEGRDALGWFKQLIQSRGRAIPQAPEEEPAHLRPGALMFDWAQEQMKFAEEWDKLQQTVLPQRTVQRVEDIDSPGALARWTVGSINDMAAFVAQVMIGKGTAGHPGALIATAIPSISEVSAEIYKESGGEIHPELSIPLGMAIAALEKFGFEQVTKGITAPVRGKLRNQIVGRLLTTLQGGGVEAGTEPTQELITIIAGNLTGPEKKAWDGMSDDDKSRLINAAWTGLVGGLVLSGAGGSYGQYMAEEDARALDQFRKDNPEMMGAVQGHIELAMKLHGMEGMEKRGQDLLNAARESAVKREEQAAADERLGMKERSGLARAAADAAALDPQVLDFINRNEALRALINDGDPAAIADRLNVSEEEAAEIINAFAQEEVVDAQEEVQEEEALAEEREEVAPTPVLVDQFGQPIAAPVVEEAAPAEEVVPEEEQIPPEEQARIDYEAEIAEQEADEVRLRRVELAAQRNTVKQAIADGAETVREIVTRTGLDTNTVRGYANDLSDAEEVERQGTGSTTDPFRFVPPGAPTRAEVQQQPRAPEDYEGMVLDLIDQGIQTVPEIVAGLRDQYNAAVTPQRVAGMTRRLAMSGAINRQRSGNQNIFTPAAGAVAPAGPQVDVRQQLPAPVAEAVGVEAELAAAGPIAAGRRVEPTPPQPPPPSPQRSRMERKAARYSGLLAAANTVEEVNAIQRQWDAEKSKPWWMGIDEEIATRRALVVPEARAEEAVEEEAPKRRRRPKPKPIAQGRRQPSPEEQAEEQGRVAQEATEAQRGVWDAAKGTQVTPEVARRITEGIGEDGFTAQALAKADPEIAQALKSADVATAAAILQGKVEAYRKFHKQKPLRKRVPKLKAPKPKAEPKVEAKKEAPKKKRKAKKAEELSEVEQQVLDSVKAGLDTVSKIKNATGIPKGPVRSAFHALADLGLVSMTQEKAEKGYRNVVTPVEEAGREEAQKEYREEKKKRKEEKKEAKEEEEAKPKETEFERVKREYQDALTPRQEEEAGRESASERGSIQLLTEEQQQERDDEARKKRSLWARHGFRDYFVRGGKIFTEGGLKPRGKMSKGQRIAWNELVAMIEAAVKQGHADRRMIDGHISKITRNPDKVANIGRVVTEYLQGKLKTTEEVAKIIGVPANSQFMKDIEAARTRNSERHAKLMESDLLPNRVKMLLADKEFYLRRAYERFLRDKRVVGRWRKHKPTQGDVKEAVDLVNSQYSRDIEKLSKRLFSIQDSLPADFDLVGFLEGTNDKELLGELDGGLADRLLDLRSQLQRWEKGIEINEAETGKVFIVENADAVRDMAAQMVEVLIADPALSIKQGGRLKIGNLKRRTLVDVFRRLYGEVYDPAILQALTVEAQGTLIAQSVFFEQMQKHGHNLVWANGPDIVPGLTERLGDRKNEEDVFRYGSLTGKYVDPLFKDFLDRKGFKDSGLDELLDFATADPKVLAKYLGGGFQKLQGITRQFALTSVGAWLRNFVSSYAQFALQAGDVWLPGFNREFVKGVVRSMKAIMGDEVAMREISDDMEKGAFRYTQTSLLQDLAPVLKAGKQIPRTTGKVEGAEKQAVELGWKAYQKIKSLPQKLKESYILIDYAAKKAAWEARYAKAKKLGKSDAVAAQYAKEHVAKYYQNAERVPEAIQMLSKLGLTDFAGFKYDSGRMAVNAAVNVGVSMGMGKDAKEGTRLHEWMGILNEHPDLIDTWQPLVGFGSARVFGAFGGLWGPGQYLFMFGSTGKLMSVIGATLMRAFGWHDDDDEIEEMTAEESRAMNEILPIYDANSQRWEYRVKDKDGKKKFTIVPLGSQFGNAAEEMVIGIVQRMAIGKETPAEILNSYLQAENIGEVIPMGMTMSNLFELISGYDPQTSRRQPNIAGALEKAAAPAVSAEEFAEAMMNFFADTGGSFGRSYKRWQTAEDRAGRTPRAGTYLKEIADEPLESFQEWMGPIIRPLRPIDLDEHEVLRRMGYKWSEAAYGIMLNKAKIGTPERKGLQLGLPTDEELAKGEAYEERYQAALHDLARRVDKAKPAFEYLGIHEEQIIGRLRSVKSGNMQLSKKELDAIVYNKVDEYINGEDYYEPDPTITPDQKGETLMRVMMARDPFVTTREVWQVLESEGFTMGDNALDKKFVERYKRIRAEMIQKRMAGEF